MREAATEIGLLRWVTEPRPDAGIRFANSAGGWRYWPYDRLAEAALRMATALRESGVGSGDVVLTVQPNGPGFVATYFGAMLAGAVPAPAPPPRFGQDVGEYGAMLRHLAGVARPRLTVTSARLRDQLGECGIAATTDEHLLARSDADAAVHPPAPAGLAMLQFTSGSVARPRAVRIPFAALDANVAAIGGWLGMTPGDPTASWLPLHHDMGLIGCLLTPLASQADLWLLNPEQFLRDPVRYLRCFGEHGAALTAMPTFGLAHVVRRVRPAALSGLDFTAWRAVIVGAERVDVDTLDRFHRLLAPNGLARQSLLPAYGLGEATLAVTGLPLDEQWTAVELDPGSLTVGARASEAPETSTGSAVGVVGCGRPLPGVAVSIQDDAGRTLPDGHVGEIAVFGAGLAAGYHNPAHDLEDDGTRFTAGQVATGDAGFLRDGQLFVLGRLGDSLKVRGRTVFAETVEAALADAGLPRHRHAVLLGVRAGRPTAVVVLEHADRHWPDRAARLVARIAEGATIVVVTAPTGTVARTTSGKPRRRELWRRYLRGELARHAS